MARQLLFCLVATKGEHEKRDLGHPELLATAHFVLQMGMFWPLDHQSPDYDCEIDQLAHMHWHVHQAGPEEMGIHVYP